MTVLAYLSARLDALLAELGATLRILLHPRDTRRRLRWLQQQLHRVQLGKAQLVLQKLALADRVQELTEQLQQGEAVMVDGALTLDDATALLGELQEANARLRGERDDALAVVASLQPTPEVKP